MKVSQVIADLQKLQAEFGDIQVNDTFGPVDQPIAMNQDGVQVLHKDDPDGPAHHIILYAR